MNLFNSVRSRKPKYNAFDLSHERKLTCNMGDLIPILCQEIVPGDRFRVNTEMLMRLAPMVSPVMHRVNVYTHFFFVPNRLIWPEWEKFITGGEDGLQAPNFPRLLLAEDVKSSLKKGSLADYFGVPPVDQTKVITNDMSVSSLPFLAYHKIYDDYYRDQNLEAPVFPLANASRAEQLKLRKRAWEKDYFTSCLPWAQRGGEVTLPSEHEITYKVPATNTTGNTTAGNVTIAADGRLLAPAGSLGIDNIEAIDENITLNELRKAVKLQEWLEKSARFGSRYIEQILAHFGVRSSDHRLQRPEFLGGGKAPVVISEVLSTVESSTTPQGNMAGHGISTADSNRFAKYFEEHGFIIGIMSVLPRTAYQQGLDRHFMKFDKFDYFWPEFAQLGEQEVQLRELFHDWNVVNNTDLKLFGYQSRYAEYKYAQSTVHGDFRDNLSFWHMGRVFANEPALNNTFIKADPTHRIFAVEDDTVHKLYVQLYHNIQALRPMPVFGDPAL